MMYIFVVFIVCIVIVFYIASYKESNQLRTKVYEIEHQNIKKEVNILFFSDVHIGKWYHQNHLPMILMKIEMEKPDILICGGDFIDQYMRDQNRIDIREIMNHLEHIKVPHKYAIMGNHDYSLYKRMIVESGFTLLENQQVIFDDISIIGLEDYLHGRPSMEGMVFDEKKVHIVAIHEPDAVDNFQQQPITLFLSGHTHGGQVNIPYVKKWVLPRAGKKYLKGKYMLSDTSAIIVSSGIGRTCLPLRLGNPPELVKN